MEILENVVSDYETGEKLTALKEKLDECVMTDEALRIIDEAGLKEKVFCKVAQLIKENMESWAEKKVKIEAIIFADGYNFLSQSPGAGEMLTQIKGED